MSSHPFFSIVTVTSNPGLDLDATVKSVFSQHFTDFEYIIKDAGSTDGSRERLPNDPRLRVYAEPDQGIYDAMNRALSRASGNYIHFLNAGDVYTSADSLARVARAIQEQAEKPAMAYTFYTDRLSNSLLTYPGRLNRWFLYRGNICHQAQFFREDSIRAAGGYDLSYSICADRELTLRILKQPGATYMLIPESTVLYRGGGYSSNHRVRQQEEHKRISELYFSAGERRIFELLRRVTFPSLRSRLARHPSNHPLHRLYYRLRRIARRWM